jgi:hypothetical protein
MDDGEEGGETQVDDTLSTNANETTMMVDDADTQRDSSTTTITRYDTFNSSGIQSHGCSRPEVPDLTNEKINVIFNRFRDRNTSPVENRYVSLT